MRADKMMASEALVRIWESWEICHCKLWQRSSSALGPHLPEISGWLLGTGFSQDSSFLKLLLHHLNENTPWLYGCLYPSLPPLPKGSVRVTQRNLDTGRHHQRNGCRPAALCTPRAAVSVEDTHRNYVCRPMRAELSRRELMACFQSLNHTNVVFKRLQKADWKGWKFWPHTHCIEFWLFVNCCSLIQNEDKHITRQMM